LSKEKWIEQTRETMRATEPVFRFFS
jgi:hypothetical protein